MKKPMAKPIVLHITSSLLIGGAEKLLADLLAEFIKNEHNQFEHQVIYFKPGPNLTNITKLGIKTHHVTGFFNHYDPICLFKLYKLVKQIQPSYLHATLWTANFYTRMISKLLGITSICTIHSNHNNGHKACDNLLKLILDQLSLNWANKIVTVSPLITDKISHPKYGITPAKIITINNGILVPSKLDTNHNHHFTIGHVGRFVPVKNQALLIEALAIVKTKIPDFKAIIIGHGVLELKLKTLVKQLGLTTNITFVATSNPQVYYPKFDCFVLPSHQEGQSIALLEAMSFGITPIITCSKKTHDIIQHLHNGIICPPNQPDKLAAAIIRVGTNDKLKENLSKQAYLTVKNQFNLAQTANKYLALYQ